MWRTGRGACAPRCRISGRRPCAIAALLLQPERAAAPAAETRRAAPGGRLGRCSARLSEKRRRRQPVVVVPGSSPRRPAWRRCCCRACCVGPSLAAPPLRTRGGGLLNTAAARSRWTRRLPCAPPLPPVVQRAQRGVVDRSPIVSARSLWNRCGSPLRRQSARFGRESQKSAPRHSSAGAGLVSCGRHRA